LLPAVELKLATGSAGEHVPTTTVAPAGVPATAAHVGLLAAAPPTAFVHVNVPVNTAPGPAVAGNPAIATLMSALFTVVVIEGLQRAGNVPVPVGHPGSPPPRTLAVLVTLEPAAAVGVTGITKLVLPLTASPAATVHTTVWLPAGFNTQPAGNVPIVKPVGIVSVTVEAAVVAAVPVLLNVKV
jgi:hypothetical protein